MTLSSSPGESKVQKEQRIAGRALDREVEAKVFGVVWNEALCRTCGHTFDLDGCTLEKCEGFSDLYDREHPADTPRPYSTSIAAAWDVVEKMREKHADVMYTTQSPRFSQHYVEVSGWVGHKRVTFPADADTFPHAVCLAALAALENAPSSSVPSTGGEL